MFIIQVTKHTMLGFWLFWHQQLASAAVFVINFTYYTMRCVENLKTQSEHLSLSCSIWIPVSCMCSVRDITPLSSTLSPYFCRWGPPGSGARGPSLRYWRRGLPSGRARSSPGSATPTPDGTNNMSAVKWCEQYKHGGCVNTFMIVHPPLTQKCGRKQPQITAYLSI